jgi:hypothetical protein
LFGEGGGGKYRVDGVLVFLLSRPKMGPPPPMPSPAGEFAPPRPLVRGEGRGGVGGGPNSNEGTYTVILYVFFLDDC